MGITIKKTSKTKPPARVVIYGDPGIGKSFFGAQARDPIFLCTEMGIAGLKDLSHIDLSGPATKWEDVLDAVIHLGKEKHDYKTLVLDTIDGVAKLCSQFICDRDYGGQMAVKKGKSEAFMQFYQGFNISALEMQSLLQLLDRLIEVKGMQVMFLSHVDVHNIKNATGADYGKFAGGMDKRIWNVIAKWCDIIGYAHHESRIYGDKDNKGGKEIKKEERILTFLGSGGMDCKSRAGYEMPNEMPLDYKQFAKELYR